MEKQTKTIKHVADFDKFEFEESPELKKLDDIVYRLKSAPYFYVQTKDYRFRFYYNNGNLYMQKKHKDYKISNFGSALYAFAAELDYFELVIAEPDKYVHQFYMLYEIDIEFN